MMHEFCVSESIDISVDVRYSIGIAGVCDAHSYVRYGVGITGVHDARQNRVHRLSRFQLALESL